MTVNLSQLHSHCGTHKISGNLVIVENEVILEVIEVLVQNHLLLYGRWIVTCSLSEWHVLLFSLQGKSSAKLEKQKRTQVTNWMLYKFAPSKASANTPAEWQVELCLLLSNMQKLGFTVPGVSKNTQMQSKNTFENRCVKCSSPSHNHTFLKNTSKHPVLISPVLHYREKV